MSALLTAQNISYKHPDGTAIFQDFSLNLHREKVGLIGKNGVGKSTLLQVLAGERPLTSGRILQKGIISTLPQSFDGLNHKTIAQIMGISSEQQRGQNHSILTKFKISSLDVQIPCAQLSCGQKMRLLFAKCLQEDPDLIFCDEPTNHLDQEGRKIFQDLILQQSHRGLLIASHDVSLLQQMDRILEISNLGIKSYGGNYDFYRGKKEQESKTAQEKYDHEWLAWQEEKKCSEKQKEMRDKRDSHGNKRAIHQGMSRLERNAKKGRAQLTSAKLNKIHDDHMKKSWENVTAAKANLSDFSRIKIYWREAMNSKTRLMISARNLNFHFLNCKKYFWKKQLNFDIFGQDRVGISGNNATGKTTLLKMILGDMIFTCGNLITHAQSVGYLDQEYAGIQQVKTVLENLQSFASEGIKEHELRIHAAQFLFLGNDVFQKAFSLSCGEKFRLSLACLLIANPQLELLILDEPTNNLDLDSREILINMLQEYQGCLILVSHDDSFLKEIGLTKEIFLERNEV